MREPVVCARSPTKPRGTNARLRMRRFGASWTRSEARGRSASSRATRPRTARHNTTGPQLDIRSVLTRGVRRQAREAAVRSIVMRASQSALLAMALAILGAAASALHPSALISLTRRPRHHGHVCAWPDRRA